ncbi:putative integrase [Nostocoides jenkinsii Ben 74]|uniref:Putative integrase n=1 Tax=Nostocoides jenkinsii Ben 74 TaxID=1193518 RepID=A0A077MDV1_9MICO|nr:site-specific integrase [Tetrasphaera jenkinsii]CCI54095.1 putative integrase [Tetrasphaera jenkinsii Ben 74]
MKGRRRLPAGDTTSSKYRGADGRWHARVTMGTRLDGRPERKHISRSSKSELDRAVRALERSRDTGQYSWTESDPTLGQWLEHWLENVLPSTVRWKTLSTYRSQMRVHVVPALGPVRLSQLRPETLEQHYRRLLDAGHSASLVHAVHRVLRSGLNEAVRRQRLVSNPAMVARPPRHEVTPLTKGECLAILAVARTRRNSARWSVALALGLRQGEALGIKWADIDFEAGTLRIQRAVQRHTWEHGCSTNQNCGPNCGGKRGADCPARRGGGIRLVETKTSAPKRSIAVPPPLLHELRIHRREQAQEGLRAGPAWARELDLAFTDEAGRAMDSARDWRDWKSILRAAGVRNARLHDARHTAATLLLVQGVDIRTVMAIMGWTEMATAQRYAHAVDDLRVEAARQIGTALWPETPQAGHHDTADG